MNLGYIKDGEAQDSSPVILDDPQTMTTLPFITLFLHCPCRSGCWSPWPLTGDRCRPQSRQSDRDLLSEQESPVTYRDRGTGGPQGCRLFGKSWAGELTNTILQEPPQPNQVQQSLKETTQHRGHYTKNSYLLCLHTPEFKLSSSKSRHHKLLSPCYTWGNWGNSSTSDQQKK